MVLAGMIAGAAASEAALGGTAGTGADRPLQPLVTGQESRGWEAVGRLELGGGGFCTAALVAPDQVLTAAHCLFDGTTGHRLPLAGLEFRAGWRNGRAEALRRIRRGAVHPGYIHGKAASVGRVRHDLALLELDRAIRLPGLVPFGIVPGPRQGEAVAVVSHARERPDMASLQEGCHVLAGIDGVVMLSCAVGFGASGAPVFRIGDGLPRILSVVSARAAFGTDEVALAAVPHDGLKGLRAGLAADRLVAARRGRHGMSRFGTGLVPGADVRPLRP
ncbi:serine protease [Rhodovulum sp. MB263]|uniref:trypsin-like serine peptidase n=1 Tax=Rhodovulum sp. (strain MB263) TaxID=308754 RepID=UPI0018C88B3E|nr:trypsin-like peptidase domain-containing protein [Rhodovulum sp. MB263]